MIQIKSFISTKAEYLDDKVNKWLEENHQNILVQEIRPYMSYAAIKDKGAYMIGCAIIFNTIDKEEA